MLLHAPLFWLLREDLGVGLRLRRSVVEDDGEGLVGRAAGFQRSTEVPPRRSALSVCPCGRPWGTPLQLEIRCSWAPVKPPEGRSTKVTSAKGHFCAYPIACSDSPLVEF